MDRIVDFNCTYDGAVGVPAQVAEKLQLKFPEAYLHGESMALLAKEIKNHEGTPYCILPFCHTVEGEALGGLVNMGSADIGPRAKDYICETAEDLLELPELDFKQGRIAELLKACRQLRDQGENVALQISGPFTILNVLIDARHIFRILKKQPDVADQIFNKLRRDIFRFMQEAKKAGVNLLSYADSSGGVNILGPKLAERMVVSFTYPLIKDIMPLLDDKTLLLLCPKTSFALLGTGKAEWEDILLPGPMTYGDACVFSIGKARILGEMCVKNTQFKLCGGRIKRINLL